MLQRCRIDSMENKESVGKEAVSERAFFARRVSRCPSCLPSD